MNWHIESQESNGEKNWLFFHFAFISSNVRLGSAFHGYVYRASRHPIVTVFEGRTAFSEGNHARTVSWTSVQVQFLR
jgi:hypothetical protein